MAQGSGQEDREKTTALKDLLSRIDLDELMKKDEPPFSFPKTLEEFEYAFNEDGQLRHTETGEPFVFNAREDLHRWNQKRYEALGEIITLYVYELLEKTCNMTKAILPVDASPDEPTSFIYLTPDALLNPSKLLVLIQGSGVERAGQWARRLIINQDLDSGTQIPFITRAIQDGYGVVVLNPNENYQEVEKPARSPPPTPPGEPPDEPAEKRERKDDKESKKKREFYEKYRNPQKEMETDRIPVRENASSEEHVVHVWDHFVSKAEAKNVFIMAHSYGGLSFVELHCCNWVSSSEPLDAPLDSMLPDCPRVSAGTERHELTPWMSFNSIFRFFNEVLELKEDDKAEGPFSAVTTRSGSLKPNHQNL
ncbi:cotranscriptional regulator FAM172A homolog isoform X2 [Takifugu flavidus]|uniref:cotranscriptional regulator FAM172A homolog isoform X2 n=1 Tax=Takifugu flavidus TaxID=433684 RepID=UPI0025441AC6|nr:cotranscriptional regulator FAM172A homolog isoform X2 [Takifugu flavidus]